MDVQQIKEIQTRIGATPDGVWGTLSTRALRSHLRALMPLPYRWPPSNEKDVRAFFGEPGDGQIINLDVSHLDIRYAGSPVKSMRCHQLVSESLLRILEDISASEHAYLLHNYAGVYNYRPMRGGRSLSRHAWGVAIDIDPAHNTFRRKWPQSSTMPIEVMEIFAKEGWTSAGAFWGYDAMHFEATTPR